MRKGPVTEAMETLLVEKKLSWDDIEPGMRLLDISRSTDNGRTYTVVKKVGDRWKLLRDDRPDIKGHTIEIHKGRERAFKVVKKNWKPNKTKRKLRNFIFGPDPFKN